MADELAKRPPDVQVVVGYTRQRVVEILRERAVLHSSELDLLDVFHGATLEDLPVIKRVARELLAHIREFK